MAIPYPKEDCLAVLLDSKARPSKHGVTFDKIEEQLRPSNPRFIQGVNNMLAGFRGFRPEITFKHRKEHGAIVFKVGVWLPVQIQKLMNVVLGLETHHRRSIWQAWSRGSIR